MKNMNEEIQKANGAQELDDDMLDGVSGGLVQLINPSSSRLGGDIGDITYFRDGRTCPKCGSGSMIITGYNRVKCRDTFAVACNACKNPMGSGYTSIDIYTK